MFGNKVLGHGFQRCPSKWKRPPVITHLHFFSPCSSITKETIHLFRFIVFCYVFPSGPIPIGANRSHGRSWSGWQRLHQRPDPRSLQYLARGGLQHSTTQKDPPHGSKRSTRRRSMLGETIFHSWQHQLIESHFPFAFVYPLPLLGSSAWPDSQRTFDTRRSLPGR